MLTRMCARCQEAKTIRGVWYVLSPQRETSPRFVCESCYAQRAPIPA